MTSSDPSSRGRPLRAEADAHKRALRAILVVHQAPVLSRSLAQMASTFLPFFGLIVTMYTVRDISAWLSLALTVPAAGLIVRIFIIQHDCGHGAFFRNRVANEWLGRFCSLITMTPYGNWRRQHANHHAVWNNLDRRTAGMDIYSTCLTVMEYRALPAVARWWYRVVRHPLIAQLLLPPLVFVLLYRIPFDTPRAWRRERASVFLTDIGLAILFTALVLLLGAGPVALVHLPTIAIAAIIGVWVFSVQHRFEDAMWSRQKEWSATGAALLGSSHLKLPRVLQWFSGNIGFHHIHHLMPRMPNYRLEDCHRACAALVSAVPSLTLMQALRAPACALWDEEKARMVRFSDLRAATPPAGAGGTGLRDGAHPAKARTPEGNQHRRWSMKKAMTLGGPIVIGLALLSNPAWPQGTPQTVSLAKVDVQKLTAGYRASKVIGSSVMNDSQETIGKVDDLLVSPDGKDPYVVLSIGGFLGMGAHLVAVPFDNLKLVEKKVVLPGGTKESLRMLPEFKYATE